MELAETVDKFEEIEYRVCYSFFMACTIWTLISATGTRFPRAVMEPPRLAPVGSSLDSLFPQESRTFLSNQELKVLVWEQHLMKESFPNLFCLQTELIFLGQLFLGKSHSNIRRASESNRF